MKTVLILLTGILLSAGVVFVRKGRAQDDAAPVVNAEILKARPIAPGEAVRDASLVDQDGRVFRLSGLRGQVVVLSFIYSHCNMTEMCPLTSTKFVQVRDEARKRGLKDLQFLLVSFDSANDPPARLKEYAQRYTSDLTDLRFASGDAEQVEPLCNQLNTYFHQESPGTYEHNVVVSIVGRDGVLRDDLFGNHWPNEELLAAIERVVKAP